jgi:hypothetical protein
LGPRHKVSNIYDSCLGVKIYLNLRLRESWVLNLGGGFFLGRKDFNRAFIYQVFGSIADFFESHVYNATVS